MDDAFDPLAHASALNEALTSSSNVFAQMTNALAALPAMDYSFARMTNALLPPPMIDNLLTRMIQTMAPPPITEGMTATLTQVNDSLAALAHINDSFSTAMAGIMTAPPIIDSAAAVLNYVDDTWAAFARIDDSHSAMAALVRSDDLAAPFIGINDTAAMLASTARSLVADMLRPSTDLLAPMSSTLMTKPIAPYSITLDTLQAQLDAEKLRRCPAEATHEALLASIRDFEAMLDDDQAVDITLVLPDQSGILHVERIGYTKPDIINFYGRVGGKETRKVQVVRHTSQLDVMLTAVPKQPPKLPHIGFI